MRADGRDAQFVSATLFGANLTQGHFERANFRGANLAGANLAATGLAGADFTGASLAHTNIASTDLSQARGLTQEQVDQACGGPSTRLPAGLVAKTCRPGVGNVIVLHSIAPSTPARPATSSSWAFPSDWGSPLVLRSSPRP